MKPEAPNSMQRRMAAGSSLADTTTTGTLAALAKMMDAMCSSFVRRPS